MQAFFAAYLERLERLHADLGQAIAGLPPEALDWVAGPATNSIAVLVVHLSGAERYWIRWLEIWRDGPAAAIPADERLFLADNARDAAHMVALQRELWQRAAALHPRYAVFHVFHHAVREGSIGELVARFIRTGHSAMHIAVELWWEPMDHDERVLACQAECVLVALGDDDRPVAVPALGAAAQARSQEPGARSQEPGAYDIPGGSLVTVGAIREARTR